MYLIGIFFLIKYFMYIIKKEKIINAIKNNINIVFLLTILVIIAIKLKGHYYMIMIIFHIGD